MPGKLTYWIFTAITDTIAWNTLLRATFPKLFRQDLLVAPQSVSPSCQAHTSTQWTWLWTSASYRWAVKLTNNFSIVAL